MQLEHTVEYSGGGELSLKVNTLKNRQRKINIGIITLFYKNYNYGAQLQAYAMQKLFTGKDTTAEIIAFEMDHRKYIMQQLRRLTIRKAGKVFCNRIKRLLNKVSFKYKQHNNKSMVEQINRKIERFDRFMDQIPHTKRYSINDMKDISTKYDLFVVGSDQVWNPNWWNDFYTINFTDKPKISYAASFGVKALTLQEKEYIKKCLTDYKHISVREDTAVELLEGIIDKKVQLVLDPTLLIGPEEWLALSNNTTIQEPYALVYNIGDIQEELYAFYQRCKENNLKVILVGMTNNTYVRNEEKVSDMILYDVGPREWLGLLSGARVVFTNSFHGTAFSLMFEKLFWCYTKQSKKYGRDLRISSLLSLCGISNRLIQTKTIQTGELFCSDLDYCMIKLRLEAMRKLSYSFIEGAL